MVVVIELPERMSTKSRTFYLDGVLQTTSNTGSSGTIDLGAVLHQNGGFGKSLLPLL